MDVTNRATALCKRFIQTVYPPSCVLCGSAGFDQLDICASCYHGLPWIESACSQCALPIANGNGRTLLCGQCLQRPPAFERSLSLFSYREGATRLIHQLKFEDKLANARLLGHMLAAAVIRDAKALPDCIVPVPLHRKRMRRRGYNQSLELARVVGRICGIPVSRRAVVRLRDTPSQTGLKKLQRRQNIRGAFDLRETFEPGRVAILDDVVTTTSTVNEIAQLLKTAGVGSVDVWSIARAV